eukprot:6489464-Amphidinium_carterae.1
MGALKKVQIGIAAAIVDVLAQHLEAIIPTHLRHRRQNQIRPTASWEQEATTQGNGSKTAE